MRYHKMVCCGAENEKMRLRHHIDLWQLVARKETWPTYICYGVYVCVCVYIMAHAHFLARCSPTWITPVKKRGHITHIADDLRQSEV